MRKLLSLTSAAALLCAVPLAQGDVVLFEENFESYAPGATSLSNDWTIINQANVGQMDHQVVNNPSNAIEGEQYWQWTYPFNEGDGIPISRMDATGWRQDAGAGIYTVSQRLYMAYNTSEVHAQSEPRYFLNIMDADGNNAAILTIQATSNFSGTRRIGYNEGGSYTYVDNSSWPRDEWLMLVLTLDEISETWSFEVANESGATIASMSGLSYSNTAFNQFDTLRLHLQTVNENRAVDTWVDDIQITGPIPEPGSMALLGLGALAMLRRRRMRN